MAQTGFYVPCSSARLSIVDHIFTRIGSSDDLSANQSTFMVEMQETAFILNNATSKSLVIMDEVGRGTSTKDGISLAFSILHHLATVNKSMCIFATHYHELAKMLKDSKLDNVGYYQAASQLDKDNHLTCLYKIRPGVMDQSHGIQIASFAGLPKSVIKQATTIYKQLEKSTR
jgi:DNA mismatch repair protein MutS